MTAMAGQRRPSPGARELAVAGAGVAGQRGPDGHRVIAELTVPAGKDEAPRHYPTTAHRAAMAIVPHCTNDDSQ